MRLEEREGKEKKNNFTIYNIESLILWMYGV
jgi:hypothetical protein